MNEDAAGIKPIGKVVECDAPVPFSAKELEIVKALGQVRWRPLLRDLCKVTGMPTSTTHDITRKLFERKDVEISVVIKIRGEEEQA